MPLTVKEIEAVAFFRKIEPDHYRVSLRSKGGIDVGAVAKSFGGGGHRNASGFTVIGSYEKVRPVVSARVIEAIEANGLQTTEETVQRTAP
jgi:phosphoesterase RecJ-like protein